MILLGVEASHSLIACFFAGALAMVTMLVPEKEMAEPEIPFWCIFFFRETGESVLALITERVDFLHMASMLMLEEVERLIIQSSQTSMQSEARRIFY